MSSDATHDATDVVGTPEGDLDRSLDVSTPEIVSEPVEASSEKETVEEAEKDTTEADASQEETNESEKKEEEKEEEKAEKEEEEKERAPEELIEVDATKPNPGKVPISDESFAKFYSTPDRSALTHVVEDLNQFPLRASGTAPIPLPFASYVAPVYVSQTPYATGVHCNTAPDDPPGPQDYLDDQEGSKGFRLFADVFSRADKNDDGGLTFEEFRTYFQDDQLTDTQLLELFDSIDADNSGNISLIELENYFKGGFEPYNRLFSGLAKMHSAISGSLGHSYKEYPQQSAFEQFKTRFYLKEYVSQLHALHEPVRSALEILHHASEVHRGDDAGEEKERDYRPAHAKVEDEDDLNAYATAAAPAGIQGNRDVSGYAGSDANAEAASVAYDVLAEIKEQVAHLGSLVQQINSSKPNLKWVQQDVFDDDLEAEESYIVACRHVDVIPELIYSFRDAVRMYLDATQAESGCKHVYIKQYANETKYALYELYHSEDDLQVHNTSSHFRKFQREIIDSLEEPMTVTLMDMPGSWWGN